MVVNMIFIFVAEITEGSKYRVRSCLSKTAHSAVLDLRSQFFQKLDIAVFSFAFCDALKNFKHSLGTDTAVVAFSAGFLFGEIQEDWEAVWYQLDDLNLEGKIVALYGLGDQLGYGEWFLDALGMLHDKLSTKGVKFVGYWPTEGYEFTSPKPVIADGQLFVGLALDETNQYDLSDERIQSWCEQILNEMAEHYA